jgi:DNA-binding CsgD family transcriptional regulator
MCAAARLASFRLGGGRFRVVSVSVAPTEEPGKPALSAAEREVFRLLLQGSSNREIAAIRGTSERTVANQVQAVFRKSGVTSRAELCARALRGG